MRAVVYKKPFEVAVGEGPDPQARHPDEVNFRAPSAVGQAKHQLSGEGTDGSIGAVGDQTQPHGGERYRPRQGLRSPSFQHVCQRPDLAASAWSAPVRRSRREGGSVGQDQEVATVAAIFKRSSTFAAVRRSQAS
jgi:hypothetical protein